MSDPAAEPRPERRPAFELLPAVDLRGGRVVRLARGDDRRRTDYGDDPEARLAAFAAAGVARAHVVDLDAAFGEPPQRPLLERLAAAAVAAGGPALELGGGLRDEAAIDWALAAGFERAVVGSLAARDPAGFARLAAGRPGRLVPALDAVGSAGGEVRAEGWRRSAGTSVDELAAALAGLPCPALLVTAVERDGLMTGADAALARRAARAAGIPALVSGGVHSLAELAELARQACAAPGELAGAVVGRALYDGAFTLDQALAACRGEAA